jgi:hypothetical protein
MGRFLSNKIISRSVFLILIIFIFCTFFKSIEIEDAWWHLKTGEWIWTHKLVPNYDLFPFFNNVKTHWLCNFEWLGSTIYYLVYLKFGFLGLKVFRSMLFLLIIGIFYSYGRKILPFYLLVVLVFILTYGCSQRYFLRPDAFNYVFIQLFLITLFSFERTSQRNILFILPILGIWWVNLHLGSFVYGASLISIFLLSAFVKFANEKLNNTLTADKQLSQIKCLSFILVVYLSTFFLTPYGIEGFLYPFRVFLDPAFINIYQFWSIAGESMPPTHFDPRLIILFILGCIFLFLNKHNGFTVLLLFVISFFLYLKCQRNITFFSILAVYGIVENSYSISFKEKYKNFFKAQYVNLFLVFFSVFLLFQIFNMLTPKWYCDGKFVKQFFIEEDPRFSALRKQLQENKITGPVYINHDILGGWLIWFGYPQWKVFVDGRHAGDNERYNDYNLIGLFPRKNWPIAEKKYGFKIVVLDSWFPSLGAPITKYFNQLPDWQLIYASGPILVYVKKGQFHLSDDLNQYSMKLKSINVERKDIERLKQLYMARLKMKQPFDMTNQLSSDTDIFLSGAALYVLGYKGAGIKYLIKTFEVGKDKLLLPFAALVLSENYFGK